MSITSTVCRAKLQDANEEIHMAKQLIKQIFGVPSLETASRIDDADNVAKAEAASYRLAARMRELEAQFEAKASELRAAFLTELAAISGVDAE
jgi:hypothetical protein